MIRFAILALTATGALAGLAPEVTAGPVNFSDNFEGATLDPFWNDNYTQSGSITFPSTLQAHTGTQSVQVNTIGGTSSPGIDSLLQHVSATPLFGTVSVWVYDTPALQSSGNYVQLFLANQAAHENAFVYARDYNLGPANGGNYFVRPFGTVNDTNSGIARTPSWHEFQITDLPNSLVLSVDGTQAFSGPTGIPFDLIEIGIFGPSFRPSETEFIDDFSLTGFTASTPEPATLALLGIGIMGMAGYGWRRRRSTAMA